MYKIPYTLPGGDKEGMRLIPISEVAAKDEFLTIKNVSRDDQLGSHRVPPQLMGIIPGNVGGFGDAAKAAEVFDANELECIRSSLLSVNEWAGEEVIRFREYRLGSGEYNLVSKYLKQHQLSKK